MYVVLYVRSFNYAGQWRSLPRANNNSCVMYEGSEEARAERLLCRTVAAASPRRRSPN